MTLGTRLIACLLVAFFEVVLLAAMPAIAGEISVFPAGHGDICSVTSGSAGDALRHACNGAAQCTYVIPAEGLGHSAAGCPNDYFAEYTCKGSSGVNVARAPAEAGSQMTLDCSVEPSAVATLTSVITMRACEGKSCGVWTFAGDKGEARWPAGQVAALTWEAREDGDIIIYRTDVAGLSKGLTAIYTGARTGGRVVGNVTWTFADGHKASGRWSSDIDSVTVEQARTRSEQALAKGAGLELIRWLLAGSALGDGQMENDSGVALTQGIGLRADLGKARSLFEAAARQGNQDGERNFALFLAQGIGGPKDVVEAANWYKKAGVAGGQGMPADRSVSSNDSKIGASILQYAKDFIKEFNKDIVAVNKANQACQRDPACVDRLARADEWDKLNRRILADEQLHMEQTQQSVNSFNAATGH